MNKFLTKCYELSCIIVPRFVVNFIVFKYLVMRLFILLCFISVSQLFGQQTQLLVSGTSGDNFLQHKVTPKENWYSVGRMYNVHPKDLAVYNKSSADKGLQIDQIINVPITAQNRVDFFGTVDEGEEKVPLMYTVKKDDVLYRIAVNNGTTMQAIREWNNIAGDAIILGSKLKVGFLKVKIAESALVNASLAQQIAVTKDSTLAATNPTVTKNDLPATTVNTDPSKPTVINVKPGTELGKIDETQRITDANNATSAPVAKIDEPKTQPAITAAAVFELNGAGFYKSGFEKAIKQAMPTSYKTNSTIFKADAGWDDDKYFVLLNGVTPGTIVKIKNEKNNKELYALVLDNVQLLGTTQINCSISNATAYALGIKNVDVFEIEVTKP